MLEKKTTTYVTSKIDNKEYCKTNGQFSRHLKNHNITYQQYYEKYITGVEEKCAHCQKTKIFYQKNHSYGKTCGGDICVGKEISITKANWTEEQKLKDSKNKKNIWAKRSIEEIQHADNKRKKTNLEKYGVEYSTQSKNNKEKTRKTKLIKYGNEYYSGWEKSSIKNRNKSMEEKNEINDKRRKTNLRLYGVENVFLREDAIKNSKISNSKGKLYILPSGKIIGIRGYENLALDKLFNNGYDEKDLNIHDRLTDYTLPIFEYITVERQHYKYYPDIYIQKENLIIEIKSQWWWDGHGHEKYKKRLINNQRKIDSVVNRGYSCQVWIFKENIKKFEIYNYD